MDGAVPRSGGCGREGRGHRSRFDDLWRHGAVVVIIHCSPMPLNWDSLSSECSNEVVEEFDGDIQD